MSKFSFAYCVETAQNVDILDVQNMLRDNISFTLQCPDEQCRLMKPDTKLTAVSCGTNSLHDRVPHFRTFPKKQHSEICLYKIISESRDYVMSHKKKFRELLNDPENEINLLKSFENGIDSSLVVDEFDFEYSPRDFADQIRNHANEYRARQFSKERSYQMACCVTPYKTSKLEVIVDTAFVLQKTANLDNGYVKLPGRRTTYNKAFFQLPYIKHNYIIPYIYYDEATVRHIDNCFYIQFTTPILSYTEREKDMLAVMKIDPKDHTRSFMKSLLDYSINEKKVVVYSFSKHSLSNESLLFSDNKSHVAIKPRVMGSTVITNRFLNK